MKKLIILIVTIIFIFSCKKQSDLSKIYDCSQIKIENPKTIIDFNKNFKLTISSNWKTKLYFSEFESEIFTADTIKQLTKSFILAASFNSGKLKFDTNYYTKIDSILIKNNLQLINSGNETFQSQPMYWYVAKGFKNKFTYHKFNLTSKRSKNTYFNSSVEIYGDDNVNERICKAISILEKVEFLQ